MQSVSKSESNLRSINVRKLRGFLVPSARVLIVNPELFTIWLLIGGWAFAIYKWGVKGIFFYPPVVWALGVIMTQTGLA